MRIVFVVPMLAPYAIPRYKELAKNDGVEVHVIVEKASSNERIGWKFDEIEGVKTYLLHNSLSHKFTISNKNGNYSQSDEHIFPLEIRKIIKSINPDIVLTCNASQLLTLIGPHKYKLGVVIEDTLRADESRKPLNKFIKKLLLRTADFYCPFSDDSIEYLRSYKINDKMIPTSWSMNNEDFTNMTEEEKQQFVEDKNMCNNKINYLIVSNLIKRKGINEFLNAWKKIPHEILEKLELLIAGEGPERKNIESLISDLDLKNVTLLGNVEYTNIKKYLQTIDVFVLPTLEDLNSLSVYEALAAARPLLISKYNGSRFLVSENENGFVFDPYDVNDVVSKVVRISNANLNKMSEISGKLSKKYTNEAVMGKFLQDLKSLLNE